MEESFSKKLIKKIRRKDQTLEDEMSFFDHLEVLRWHFIRSLAVLFAFTIVAFLNREIVFDKILFGPKSVDFWTYRQMCKLGDMLNIGGICIEEIPFTLMNTQMVGQFTLHITSSLVVGFILAFPYILWEIWRFIRPALYSNEKKYSTGFVFFSSMLFGMGVLFGYFIFVPLSISFLSNYIVSDIVTNQYTLSNYISTVATLTLAAGLIFELPIVIYFLSKVGIITPSIMKRNRRYAIVIILIVSAVITPSADVLTQVVVATPLLILYEISIFVSGYVVRKNKEKEEEELAEDSRGNYRELED
ncbi:sec-independent protein translocase protein TatC [Anseongella ginsenosidimutans]|uniref:Sec-independent protein translocase protein TatC n=1 Tax=Anseongella ginsenosidimutans TaxID=496056 RepID=A0A4R3KR32_9SPHI|nr:twin-arginine translocase subunit TatC [Anseongella ginsenosidimutans]TCS86715.1 sec-independent protein translocase protein TatC [Anseongella ginsenosidimutans]